MKKAEDLQLNQTAEINAHVSKIVTEDGGETRVVKEELGKLIEDLQPEPKTGAKAKAQAKPKPVAGETTKYADIATYCRSAAQSVDEEKTFREEVVAIKRETQTSRSYTPGWPKTPASTWSRTT